MAVTLQPEAQQGQGLERVRLQDGMRPAERVNVGGRMCSEVFTGEF